MAGTKGRQRQRLRKKPRRPRRRRLSQIETLPSAAGSLHVERTHRRLLCGGVRMPYVNKHRLDRLIICSELHGFFGGRARALRIVLRKPKADAKKPGRGAP